MDKITEAPSVYRHLEQMDTSELLQHINTEDHKVPEVIKELIPKITELVDIITDHMLSGGRLFYVGAGTSGRLGIVDASECPPTFGVPHGMVVGLIAGGDGAIRKAVELAEDNKAMGWEDLQAHKVDHKDVVIGIAASGSTPYVIGALEGCNEAGIVTASISCNPGSPMSTAAKYPIEAVVGPEFVTGSTRMKSGTAQKLILNMISTAVMIKLGRVEDNKMVDMQLSNEKLVERGTHMVMDKLQVDHTKAKALLLKHGSVREAVKAG